MAKPKRRPNIGRRTAHARRNRAYYQRLKEKRRDEIEEKKRLSECEKTRRSLGLNNQSAFPCDLTANNSDDANLNTRSITLTCRYCNASKTEGGTDKVCCTIGKVKQEPSLTPPKPLDSLSNRSDFGSRHFRPEILDENDGFLMCSSGTTNIREGGFMPTCEVKQGESSHRSVDTDSCSRVNYPTDFPNDLDVRVLPPQNSQLKVGTVFTIQRKSISPRMSNGTRLFVKNLTSSLIEAIVMDGRYAGKSVFIPTSHSHVIGTNTKCDIPTRDSRDDSRTDALTTSD